MRGLVLFFLMMCVVFFIGFIFLAYWSLVAGYWGWIYLAVFVFTYSVYKRYSK